jgi:hypothetical protein
MPSGSSFMPDPRAEARRRSIAQLIRIIVSVDHPDVLNEQKLQVIDTLLWKFTEADGKHNTPFRTVAALTAPEEELQHEHVFTRKQLKHRILASTPDDVDSILADAIGCLVTVEEHKRLSCLDGLVFGWQRYLQAGIPWKAFYGKPRVLTRAVDAIPVFLHT